MDPNTSNPMEAVSSIMKSGVFNDLIQGMGSGLEDGSLDMNKLMGTVSTMVTQMNDDASDEDKNSDSVVMINNMMKNLTTQLDDQENNEESKPLDISTILGPMLEGGGGNGESGQPDLSAILGPLVNGGAEGGPPNLANMLGPMLGMIGNNMGGPPSSSSLTIEENINQQLEQSKNNK